MFRYGMAAILIGLCLGCGRGNTGNRVAVEGKVTLDGTAVEDGAINFVPTAGTKGPSAGGRIQQGQYSLSAADGPVVGNHRVEIRVPRPTGKKIPNPYKAGEMVEEIKDAVPERYNTGSALQRELKAGKNVIDFELTTR